jgi:biotin carboxylase
LGDHLYKENIFRGMFGIDFVVDYDTFDLYLMEVNPRMTGSTTISYYTYQAEGIQFPFGLFHFAEYMDLTLDLPIDEYNKAWEETTLYKPATHIPIKPFSLSERNIDFTGFPPGLWRRTEKGFEYTERFTWKLQEMAEEDILFIPNRGFSKGNIIMKKKCQ